MVSMLTVCENWLRCRSRSCTACLKNDPYAVLPKFL